MTKRASLLSPSEARAAHRAADDLLGTVIGQVDSLRQRIADAGHTLAKCPPVEPLPADLIDLARWELRHSRRLELTVELARMREAFSRFQAALPALFDLVAAAETTIRLAEGQPA